MLRAPQHAKAAVESRLRGTEKFLAFPRFFFFHSLLDSRPCFFLLWNTVSLTAITTAARKRNSVHPLSRTWPKLANPVILRGSAAGMFVQPIALLNLFLLPSYFQFMLHLKFLYLQHAFSGRLFFRVAITSQARFNISGPFCFIGQVLLAVPAFA